nr:MAG TPA: hypothetical protein [Caudoviricetes sp.]
MITLSISLPIFYLSCSSYSIHVCLSKSHSI